MRIARPKGMPPATKPGQRRLSALEEKALDNLVENLSPMACRADPEMKSSSMEDCSRFSSAALQNEKGLKNG